MGLHVYEQAISDVPSSSQSKYLRLLTAYENGGVVLRQYDRNGKEMSVESQGWNIIWKAKLHAESGMFFSY